MKKFFRWLFRIWKPAALKRGRRPEYAFSKERHIYGPLQITDPSQITRGKVIIYHQWQSGIDLTKAERMLVLSEPYITGSNIDLLDYQFGRNSTLEFAGLFLMNDGSTWRFYTALADASVVPYSHRDLEDLFQNLSWLEDTGETMTEAEIEEALKKNKNV